MQAYAVAQYNIPTFWKLHGWCNKQTSTCLSNNVFCNFPWRACVVLSFGELSIDCAANILANVKQPVKLALEYFGLFFNQKLFCLFAGHFWPRSPESLLVQTCCRKLTWCCSNLLNQPLFKNRQKTTLAGVWSLSGFITIDFLCYLHRGLCSQISGIRGLTRELRIVFDTHVVWTDNARVSKLVYLQTKPQKLELSPELKKGQAVETSCSAKSGWFCNSASFLCCVLEVVTSSPNKKVLEIFKD